jgi:chromosome segregation ATPase
MYRARIALPILLGVIVAIWGCTTPSSTTNEAKSIEARVAKIEKELKTTQDQLKLEQTRAADAERERDLARGFVKQRTEDLAKSRGELEAVQKDLKALLGRVDLALGNVKSTTEVSLVQPKIELK